MIHYRFRRLVFLANIDPTNVGGRDHLTSKVQRRDIRKKDGSTTTITVSERLTKENKWQYRKRKLDMDQCITNRTPASNNPLLTKVPKVTDYALQPGGTLAQRLSRYNPHCPKPVTGS